jgi:nucleoside-diphosphate-sugar epimerase
MSTVVVSGLGVFGGWVVEFLARTPGVERIVAIDRVPRTAPSRLTMAMIGSVFQGHTKAFDYHQVDLSETDRLARLLAEVGPDAIVHTATLQSPRRFAERPSTRSGRRPCRAPPGCVSMASPRQRC